MERGKAFSLVEQRYDYGEHGERGEGSGAREGKDMLNIYLRSKWGGIRWFGGGREDRLWFYANQVENARGREFGHQPY